MLEHEQVQKIVGAINSHNILTSDNQVYQNSLKWLEDVVSKELPEVVKNQLEELNSIVKDGLIPPSELHLRNMVGLLNISLFLSNREELFENPEEKDDFLIIDCFKLTDRRVYSPESDQTIGYINPKPVAVLFTDDRIGVGFAHEGIGSSDEEIRVAAMTHFLLKHAPNLTLDCLAGDSINWFDVLKG